jgi:hypothetical protein
MGRFDVTTNTIKDTLVVYPVEEALWATEGVWWVPLDSTHRGHRKFPPAPPREGTIHYVAASATDPPLYLAAVRRSVREVVENGDIDRFETNEIVVLPLDAEGGEQVLFRTQAGWPGGICWVGGGSAVVVDLSQPPD